MKSSKKIIIKIGWGLRQANLGPMTQVDPRWYVMCSNSTWTRTSGLGAKTGCPGVMTKVNPWVLGPKNRCLETP